LTVYFARRYRRTLSEEDIVSAKQRTTPDVQSASTIHEFTVEEARELFDRMARFNLSISGDEFMRRWDAGEYSDRLEESDVLITSLYMRVYRDEL
jgi:hypothetical protein